ncbi:MAG: autoinducer-2 kinase [Actinomycetota bacterium]
MGDYLLAIDAGTGSCRAILFDPALNQVAVAAEEWSHTEIPGVPGSQRFETDENWKRISRCIRSVLGTSGVDKSEIRAIAATSMREGVVLYDGQGREVWACPNADARAGQQAGELVRSGGAKRIYELAGDWVSITTPARLMWLRENEPEIFRSVRHMGMISDWINYRLSGEFCTEPTAGSSTAMFDLTSRTWSPEILGLVDLDPGVVPPVVPPSTVIGKVSDAAADDTGLAAGTPVVTAGADTQMGLHGVGARTGQVTILGGTFWQQAVVVNTPLIDPKKRLRTLCHVSDDEWMIEGIGFYSGLAFRWFRDTFCPDLVAEAKRTGSDPYALIEEMASPIPPGSNGVVAIVGDIMRADRWTHPSPSFLQFDLNRPDTGRAACARALLENAAYVSRAHIDILSEVTGEPFDTVTLAAGASAGTLWPQIIADVLGRPVKTSPIKEATARGTALCALVGSGLGHAAADAPLPGREFAPDLERSGRYEELFGSWAQLTTAMKDLSDRGLLKPLWLAPGASDDQT